MKTTAHWIAVALLAVVLISVFRTILTRDFPFVEKFNDQTKQAFVFLSITAAALFMWAHLNLHLESVEIAGVKASVGKLQERVDTLSDQMEVFFQRKKIETFDYKNWNRVRKVGTTKDGVVMEVTLDSDPIPGSIEIYDGVLLMPEQQYHIDGRNVQFPSNTSGPDDGLTIKYYPRLAPNK